MQMSDTQTKYVLKEKEQGKESISQETNYVKDQRKQNARGAKKWHKERSTIPEDCDVLESRFPGKYKTVK